MAVFCGSSTGNDPAVVEAAIELAGTMVNRKITLVYGGANRGIMGKLADGVLNRGGHVIGVIPTFLRDVEVAHSGLTELIVTESMHERKVAMFERSDGFIALPGGFGTLEELFEIITWAQLDLHRKPIGILNVNGYYSLLLQQLDLMVEKGLLNASIRSYLVSSDSPAALIQLLQDHEPDHHQFLEKGKV